MDIQYLIRRYVPIINDFLVELIIRCGYRFKLLKWARQHSCKDFNDKGYNSRYDLYKFILEKEKLDGEIDYLEFGVESGDSLRWWVENNKSQKTRFVGFDSFEGLPEDWGYTKKGTFTVNGKLPDIQDNRCSYVVGLFQKTLFKFLKQSNLSRRKVIHMDCDLYNSTLFVLTSLAPYLKKDDIIFFDDFGGLRDCLNEFRAFTDFFSAYKFKYELIGSAYCYRKIAIKLVDVSTG